MRGGPGHRAPNPHLQPPAPTTVPSSMHNSRMGVRIVVAATVLVFAGCTQAHRDSHGEPPTVDVHRIQLSGAGLIGIPFGTPARQAQAVLTRVLGTPDRVRFSGCELAGLGAVYTRRSWTWAGLTVTFSNKAKTPQVRPGHFVSWLIEPRHGLPAKAELPDGLTLQSSPDDVRAAAPIRSAGEGLPGTYSVTTLDGVTYGFAKPFRHPSAISVNDPGCE
jgi:hypothetical protein